MSTEIATVLLVEDNPADAHLLCALVNGTRWGPVEVTHVARMGAAVEYLRTQRPDVVLLDLGLPGVDGIDVIHGLRGWTSVPIVVLSARDAEQIKVAALDAGADDYVTKPFSINELLARLRASLRRHRAAPDDPEVETAHFTIDFVARRVIQSDSTVVHLTPTEWQIVEQLVRNPGRLVTHRQLLQAVWGPRYENETNYLRVHLAAIRRKLEPTPGQPQYFITEPGIGYRFESS
jgi:two-component system KDP operon response regulator KdpE